MTVTTTSASRSCAAAANASAISGMGLALSVTMRTRSPGLMAAQTSTILRAPRIMRNASIEFSLTPLVLCRGSLVLSLQERAKTPDAADGFQVVHLLDEPVRLVCSQ